MSKLTFLSALWKRPVFRVGLLALIVVVAIGGVLGFQALTTPAPPTPTSVKVAAGAPMPSNPAIEEKWGIRISQIGVTADGGMVDFRFVVIDPEKAQAMMKDEKNLPILVPEGGSAIVNSAALMPAKHVLNPGQTYFLLYRNTKNAIRHGSAVSVLFPDELKLEHAPAK